MGGGWEEGLGGVRREGNSSHVVSLGLGGHRETRGALIATGEKPRIDNTVLTSVKPRAGIWSQVSPLSLLTLRNLFLTPGNLERCGQELTSKGAYC